MGKYPLSELKSAYANYLRVKDKASKTGDWSPFADLFTPNAYYVEHAYGEFFGREAIREYIVNVMAPFPTMKFVEDWVVYDEELGAIIWQVQNVFPEPNDPKTGKPFQFPNLSRLVYAGNGLFEEEKDWYNPTGKVLGLHAAPTTKAWRVAGGKFLTKEKLIMMHDGKKASL